MTVSCICFFTGTKQFNKYFLFFSFLFLHWASLMAMNLLATQETQVQSLGQKIPWRMKWQPTPVFLPGESHGQRSLVGYSPWGHKSWTQPSKYPTTIPVLNTTHTLSTNRQKYLAVLQKCRNEIITGLFLSQLKARVKDQK